MDINYKEIQYGFEYGSAKVTRHISDAKRGWAVMFIETPREKIQVYITKTGKVRLFNYNRSFEYKRWEND